MWQLFQSIKIFIKKSLIFYSLFLDYDFEIQIFISYLYQLFAILNFKFKVCYKYLEF